MIRTLRITSVAAVLLAGVVLASVLGPVSLISFGVRSDKQVKKVLDAPSAVDRFKEQHPDKDQSQDTTPPLVKQAELFADILKPRVPTSAQAPATAARAAVRPSVTPPVVSANFNLVGLSYSPSPAFSFAYIRLPDQTYQWVQPGSQIGHIVVKEVRSDRIIYWDGRQDVEKMVEQPPETGSMLETGKAVPMLEAPAPRQPTIGQAPSHPVAQPAMASQPVATPADSTAAGLSPEEQQNLGDLAARLRELDKDPANRAAAQQKLIEEFRSSRVSTEEAKKLGNLGEELNGSKGSPKDDKWRERLKRLSGSRATKN
jgi:hypothetical protein